MSKKQRIVAWVLVAPDGGYDVAGGSDFEGDKHPDWLGDCGVFDDHEPATCLLYKVVAEVDLPGVPTVDGIATLVQSEPPHARAAGGERP